MSDQMRFNVLVTLHWACSPGEAAVLREMLWPVLAIRFPAVEGMAVEELDVRQAIGKPATTWIGHWIITPAAGAEQDGRNEAPR